ncbi:RidA family protein [Ascidiaceihabitans sp.]|uniref:RidA family protein n=1 Tax=Ascidiaceihabitans sp. TaxID=1872644 RepID=UPI003296832C
MTAKNIHPEGWAPAKGYANGMLARDGTLYIGGQIGWTAEKQFASYDFIGQMEQALRNIVAIVEAAGGSVTDITRLTWFVIDKAEYAARQREVGDVYRRVLGRHFPAMSMLVVAGLVEDDALLEIEATAFVGPAPSNALP